MRLFLALPLPGDAKDSIAREISPLSRRSRDLSLISGENLHITLLFLGEVEQEKGQSLFEKLNTVSLATEPFRLSWRGLDQFPKRGPARLLYLAIEEGKREIREVRDQLIKAIDDPAFHFRRRYQAHISVARSKKRGSPIYARDLQGGLSPSGSCWIDTCVLFQSHLSSRGAKYERRMSLSLGRNHELD